MLNGFHLFLLDKLLNKLLDNIQTNRLTQIRKRYMLFVAVKIRRNTTNTHYKIGVFATVHLVES